MPTGESPLFDDTRIRVAASDAPEFRQCPAVGEEEGQWKDSGKHGSGKRKLYQCPFEGCAQLCRTDMRREHWKIHFRNPPLVKCPHCAFETIQQSVIDRHVAALHKK